MKNNVMRAYIILHAICRNFYQNTIINLTTGNLKINIMENLVKNFIYSGVGLVSITTEKFKSTIEELVSDKKLSSDEGKKIVDDFFKNTEDKKEEFDTQLKEIIEKMLSKFKFVSKTDIEALEERISELEKK